MKQKQQPFERLKDLMKTEYGIETLEQLIARMETDEGLDIGIFTNAGREARADGNAI